MFLSCVIILQLSNSGVSSHAVVLFKVLCFSSLSKTKERKCGRGGGQGKTLRGREGMVRRKPREKQEDLYSFMVWAAWWGISGLLHPRQCKAAPAVLQWRRASLGLDRCHSVPGSTCVSINVFGSKSDQHPLSRIQPGEFSFTFPKHCLFLLL